MLASMVGEADRQELTRSLMLVALVGDRPELLPAPD
jgi:hypothetical protein